MAPAQPLREDGKPLRADARRNRERVLEAARTAFAAEGVAVPLDEIARRAGVGPGTVYRHFPTKEALFEAVMLDRMQRLAAEARARVKDDDPTQALLEFIAQLVAEATAKRDLIDAMEQAGTDVHAALAATAEDLRRSIGRMLHRAQKAGGVRRDVSLADLMALLSGMIMSGHRHGSGRIERIVAVVCDGLRAGTRSANTRG